MELPIELLELFQFQLNQQQQQPPLTNLNQYDYFQSFLPLNLLLEYSLSSTNSNEDDVESKKKKEWVGNQLSYVLSNSKRPNKFKNQYNINEILEELYSNQLTKLESILLPSTTTTSNLLNYLKSQQSLELKLQSELTSIRSSILSIYSSTSSPSTIPLPPSLNTYSANIQLLISSSITAQSKLNLLITTTENALLSNSNGSYILAKLALLNSEEKKKLESEIKSLEIELKKYEIQMSLPSSSNNKPSTAAISKKGERGVIDKSSGKTEYERVLNTYLDLIEEEKELRADLKRLGWKEGTPSKSSRS